MATTEERMKILKMIEEGKVSAEEGAKLLSALASANRPSGGLAPAAPSGCACVSPTWLPGAPRPPSRSPSA